ncbi:MAG: hypothetical protein IPM36_00435 [Lewinellaceae bacterium]|nr:hypothetical protein [Lewinellaceae bacterium]
MCYFFEKKPHFASFKTLCVLIGSKPVNSSIQHLPKLNPEKNENLLDQKKEQDQKRRGHAGERLGPKINGC